MVKRRKNAAAEMIARTICPCCGKYHFEEENAFEDCPICGWYDDLVQRMEPDCRTGFNDMTLNEAREAYCKGEKVH